LPEELRDNDLMAKQQNSESKKGGRERVKRFIEKGRSEDTIDIFSACGKDEAAALTVLKSR
jgi:hypothetical protein